MTSQSNNDNLQAQALPQEKSFDHALRPQLLSDFIGQQRLRNQLEVFIMAAKNRKEPLDHVLLVSPPGLGKTTLATIIANEMGAPLRTTSGPALERPGDAAAILTAISKGSVLFLDEIHRLHPTIEESMYAALEDQRFDVMVGDGPSGSAAVSLDLEPFTLIGATTRAGLLTAPLRDRFGIQLRLDFYPPEDLQKIINRSAGLLEVGIDDEAAAELASRSRGTPRIANRLLRRVRDYAQVKANGKIDKQTAKQALALLEVDEYGLDAVDKRYLHILCTSFQGGPTGLDTLAVAISETTETVENFIEPFLIQQGYIARTARGRIATPSAWPLIGLKLPSNPSGLFTESDKA